MCYDELVEHNGKRFEGQTTKYSRTLKTLEVSFNHLVNDSSNPGDVFIEIVNKDANTYEWLTLTRESAVALRDHLNELLGE